jgi:hypothetical protein
MLTRYGIQHEQQGHEHRPGKRRSTRGIQQRVSTAGQARLQGESAGAAAEGFGYQSGGVYPLLKCPQSYVQAGIHVCVCALYVELQASGNS